MNGVKKGLLIFTYVLFMSTCLTLSAQDDNDNQHDIVITIPEVALLDIEGNGSYNLGVNAPTEAGNPVVFGSTINKLWINYSSIIGNSSDPSRSVSVVISSGNLPGGVDLKVQASNDAGNGGGSVGLPVSQLTLGSSPQTLISSIGSCYTGNGVGSGHQLTYILDQAGGGNYSDLDFDESATIVVTYLLSDN